MDVPMETKSFSEVSCEDIKEFEEKDVNETHQECKQLQDQNDYYNEENEKINLDATTAQVLNSIVAEVSKKSVQREDNEQTNIQMMHKSVQCEDTIEHLSNHSAIELLNKSVQCDDLHPDNSIYESTMFHSLANESIESVDSSKDKETVKILECSISTQTDIDENINEHLQKLIKEKDVTISLKEDVIVKLENTLKMKEEEIEKLLAVTGKSVKTCTTEPSTPQEPKVTRGRPIGSVKKNVEAEKKVSENTKPDVDAVRKITRSSEKKENAKKNEAVKKTVELPKRSTRRKTESETKVEAEPKDIETVESAAFKANDRTLRGRKRENTEKLDDKNATMKRAKAPVKEKRRLDSYAATKADSNKQGKAYNFRNRK